MRNVRNTPVDLPLSTLAGKYKQYFLRTFTALGLNVGRGSQFRNDFIEVFRSEEEGLSECRPAAQQRVREVMDIWLCAFDVIGIVLTESF